MVVEVPPEKVKSTVATDYNNLVENILGLARAALVVVKIQDCMQTLHWGQIHFGNYAHLQQAIVQKQQWMARSDKGHLEKTQLHKHKC